MSILNEQKQCLLFHDSLLGHRVLGQMHLTRSLTFSSSSCCLLFSSTAALRSSSFCLCSSSRFHRSSTVFSYCSCARLSFSFIACSREAERESERNYWLHFGLLWNNTSKLKAHDHCYWQLQQFWGCSHRECLCKYTLDGTKPLVIIIVYVWSFVVLWKSLNHVQCNTPPLLIYINLI